MEQYAGGEGLTFSNNLRQLRLDNGWTQAQLGSMIGVSRQAIHQLEQRGNGRVYFSTLAKLSVALGCAVEDIWDFSSPVW